MRVIVLRQLVLLFDIFPALKSSARLCRAIRSSATTKQSPRYSDDTSSMPPRCSSFRRLWQPKPWSFYLPPNVRCWKAEGSPQRSASFRLKRQHSFRPVWTRCSFWILNATMTQEYRQKLLQRLIHTTLERRGESPSSDWSLSACLWLTGTRTYRLPLRSQQAGGGRMRRTSRPRVLLSQKSCRKCLHNQMMEAKPDTLAKPLRHLCRNNRAPSC
jgi:hypothetical protein